MVSARWSLTLSAAKENGGVREDPAIPARALLPTDQGRPLGNRFEASIHWIGRARGDEPARITQGILASTRQ